MEIRDYRPDDCAALAALFYDTVHTVNARDYTSEQLDAWADGAVNLEEWNRSLCTHDTAVALEEGQIVGFGDMDADGLLDRLFVHRDFQRRGIAGAICDRLERAATVDRAVVAASITAKPFFERRGYRLLRWQTVFRRGVALTNCVMEKRLAR